MKGMPTRAIIMESSSKSGTDGRSHLRASLDLLRVHDLLHMHVGVLAGLEAERAVLDVAHHIEEEEEEQRAGDDVEDAVPDHLARRGDDVRTLGARPADRVGDEHEGEVARGEDVALAERAFLSEGAARCVHQEDVPVVVVSTAS